MKLPQSRTQNIITQDLSDELLVYDLNISKAYCLNMTSKIVFKACDGITTFDYLKGQYKFTDDLINLTLDELRRNALIESPPSNYFGNLSRREVIKRVGLASMIALPVISGIVAPTAANAQSRGSSSCTGSTGDGGRVSTVGSAGNDTAATAACLSLLNCECASGRAAGSVGFCAGAPTARSCTCNGTCSSNCVNPGGSAAGARVSTVGSSTNDTTALAACLSELNGECCSGSASGSLGFCAGAPSARSCTCNGTCN